MRCPSARIWCCRSAAVDRLECRREPCTLLDRVASRDFAWLLRSPDGASQPGRHLSGAVLLCGSFDPLHDAHRRLAEVAAGLLGRDPLFELGLLNADKASIAEAEAERRAAQFAGYAPVLLTALPRFTDKVRWVRESVFVLGADTLLRVVDPRFYTGGRAGCWKRSPGSGSPAAVSSSPPASTVGAGGC